MTARVRGPMASLKCGGAHSDALVYVDDHRDCAGGEDRSWEWPCKLHAGTITSSPGPIPAPMRAAVSELVPLAVMKQWRTPSLCAYRVLEALTLSLAPILQVAEQTSW